MEKNRRVLPLGVPFTEEHLSAGLKSRIEFEQRWSDRVADFLTESFGTTWFFILNFAFFVFWFIANSGVFGTPFDPYPYNLLTMTVSLEAIFLAIIVLMSQNRASKIGDIRQKVDFEVNVRAEEEITKVLLLIERLHEHLGVKIRHDRELREMERHTDLEAIRREAQK